ncbi:MULTISPECIES: murein biosynthesis integral membrane protein MurJ [Streptomyces]|uniref:Murein biosynthesis integral membrane protein MurJ n=2 Tax=Actinomycetes TaxID=1760 RepID=A0ABU3UQ50_9ACTN|nr:MULTISPECIES: murein biosynthesis integral membrane protein MurJ [Streptomyces]MCX4610287.1 murein biosynthesis integral membrane protein MurJ [Streptomyces mirabilis]MCX5350507.1 murein biosynthesis integral membrane protein MurJ [Streptomyces mirabilis]MDU8996036.1 murein biosynthesis integral membrane protein MurJ [Streptomyces mirabilis]QDN88891.1 murein biosynthesis integral membrane protein MurJ [Streptomyces sp. RLB3-6]QDO09721.1 murein biosynthesis integral membrane protein MurJ [St
MNAPYDGDRGQGAGNSGYPEGYPDHAAGGSGYPDGYPDQGMAHTGYPEGYPEGPPADPAQQPQGQYQDMYFQDAYTQDPYRAQDLAAQDPVSEALYDRAAHPPPPPGSYYPQQPLYAQPPTSQYTPDPRVWAQTPPPEPAGPTRHLPYGEDARTTQFVGVDDLVTQAGDQQHEPDAFAHLFRDQGQAGTRTSVATPGVPSPAHEPAPAAPQTPAPEPAPTAKKPGGRASGLLKSSAVMAAGTLVSRLTGFIRSALIVSALGIGFLGDSFQVAYQLPTMIYILTVGGGLNSVFVPQLVRAMKDDEDGGEAFANRLLTLVMVALGLLTALAVFAAPLLVRMLSTSVADNPAANEVAVTFTRYFLPTIFFMGIHVVMGQILNARGKFGAMMWTPVLNNIVIIVTLGMFIWVYGTAANSGMEVTNIPPDGQRLLGIGVLLGLVVQALAMIPYLRETGFRMRLRFDWKGHGLGKAAMLAKWTVLFVLANQAGALVVTQLATAATNDSKVKGVGFSAYANAQLVWGLPQAIITVSLMAALLPRIARSAHEGDSGAVRDDISQGLRTTAVAIVPIAFGFVALGIPMCTLIFGSSGTSEATNMGFMLMAFGLGLIPYSVQYVVLRAFYAYEDTRTPFYNTVIVAAVNAVASAACYFVLPARWAVVGMAASYGLAYAIGVGVAWNRLRKRLGGDLDGTRVLQTYARLGIASVPAALLSGAACYGIGHTLGQGVGGSLAALLAGGIALLGVFYVAARKMRIEELNSMVGMVRGRLGR